MWTERNVPNPALTSEFTLPRNHLLRTLPRHDWERLQPFLERVALKSRRVIQHAGVPIEHVYFIEDGLVSVLASADERSTVEIWLIGREGAVGTAALLGRKLLRYGTSYRSAAARSGSASTTSIARWPRCRGCRRS
jgi:CRP-like cAMP-binding protein